MAFGFFGPHIHNCIRVALGSGELGISREVESWVSLVKWRMRVTIMVDKSDAKQRSVLNEPKCNYLAPLPPLSSVQPCEM